MWENVWEEVIENADNIELGNIPPHSSVHISPVEETTRHG